MALRGLVSCPNLDQMDWERKREVKREQMEERGKMWDFYREKLYLLSKFLGDRTGELRRGKKQICSPRQGLHVGTSFGEFRQTPDKVGVFLLLALLFV